MYFFLIIDYNYIYIYIKNNKIQQYIKKYKIVIGMIFLEFYTILNKLRDVLNIIHFH